METTTGKDKKFTRRKTVATDLSSMVYGKIPPQAKDLEEAVLGAIMLEKSAFDTVVEILKPECFYVEAHQLLFEAMQGLQTKSLPIDILTVVEELRFREKLDVIGGPYFVTKLTNMVVSSANIEAHARIVLQKFIQRELIRISSQTIADAYEDSTDVFDLLDEAESRLFEITNNHLKKNFDELPTVLAKTYSRIEELRNKKEDISGCHSGFPSLDQVTNGWQPTDLIILAARPAVGKTAFALNLARNCAMHPDVTKRRGVGFFSLEMGASQLVQRILSAQSEIPMEKIARGRLEDYEMKQLLTKGLQPLESAPIYIDDSAALNVFELRAKCRRMVNKYGVGLVIIDYLQLMSGSSDKNTNREQEISGISRSLKQLAKELQIPIIALSQLSRAVESRKEGNKMPQLSDLRECVTGDTLVWLTNGQRIPIKDLVGKSIRLWSLNHNHKIVASTSEIIWPVGTKLVFELKFSSGRTMKATADHKMLCFDGWKTIGELTSGERIAVARTIPEPDSTSHITENKLILLAHLMGDGSYLTHQPLRYTTASEANSHVVQQAAEQEFGTTVNRYKGRGNWHQLVFSGNGNRWHPQGLNKWLREIGVYNQRSYQKKVPAFIFTLSTEHICFFLQHLWATDGTIYTGNDNNSGPRISFSTNSIQLAQDVAALLLRIAIVARIKETKHLKYRSVYNVEVSGAEHQLQFLKTVGAFGEKAAKAAELQQLLAGKQINTNVDTVPSGVFAQVKTAMKAGGISQREMAARRGTAYGGTSHFKFSPSRTVLQEYSDILQDDELKKICQSDIFWDSVASVTPCGEEEVFDLTVNDTHNWIANTGIITHNSGAIEQDADMVMFLYRPEYYGVTENEMGESNRGETHVKIAKHRNGSLETIVLQAQLHIQKFVDVSATEQTSYKAAMPAGAGSAGKFRPLTPDETGADDNAGGGAGLYIQRGSKMNDANEDFDTGFAENDEDALF